MPNFIKRAVKFTIAYAKWVAAGKPLRSDEYIERLYSVCEDCPAKKFIQHEDGKGECDECGCHILRAPSSETTLNKLAWPTEECPLGFWKSDVEEDVEPESSGQ